MKKFYYIIGAFATAAAIFTFIAVMLKKLRITLSIESINDDLEEPENTDIELSFSESKKPAEEYDFSETEELIRQELDGMIEADDDDIEVEIKVEE